MEARILEEEVLELKSLVEVSVIELLEETATEDRALFVEETVLVVLLYNGVKADVLPELKVELVVLKIEVDEAASLEVDGTIALEVDGTISLEVDETIALEVDGTISLEVDKAA